MPEPTGQRTFHGGATQVMSVIIILLGIGILISTISRGGFGFTYGFIVGLLFVVAGAGRLWVARKAL